MTTKAVVVFLILAICPLFIIADDIIFFSENGHYYQLVKLDKQITNEEAKNMAAARYHNSKQGYLVTVNTQSEGAFLSQYLNQAAPVAGGDYPTIWAGGYRNANSQWYWAAVGRQSTPFYDVNAVPACLDGNYCNWESSFTSPAKFPSTSGCVQVYLNSSGGPTAGQWRPVPCASLSQSLVLEYDASQTCSPGYVYRTTKQWCEDVNECANNANICGAGYRCTNTIGSYRCDDINECVETPNICKPGFQCVNGNGSYACVDINECAVSPSVCASGYDCQNLVGSYQCNDINECQANSSLCSKGYVCHNLPGSYSCDDIDECADPKESPCPWGTKCTNTLGSYTCDLLYYFIQSDWNGLVLDYRVYDKTQRLMTSTQLTQNFTSQLWSFTPDGFIFNAKAKNVIDAEGGIFAGVRAILWPQKASYYAGNQKWTYDFDTKMFTSISANLVLDIYQGQRGPGAELCFYSPKDATANANQRWLLVEYTGHI